jgi:hypothetical protein
VRNNCSFDRTVSIASGYALGYCKLGLLALVVRRLHPLQGMVLSYKLDLQAVDVPAN